MRRSLTIALALSASVLGLSAPSARAQSITVDVSRFGIYESFGAFSHSPDTGDLPRYDVGQPVAGVEARNYFVFSLTGLDFTATSATLRIFSNSTPQVDAPGQTNQMNIFSVETLLDTVTNSPQGTGDYGPIFTDLGAGTLYGTTTLIAANIQQGTAVDIPLTGALTAINAAAGSRIGLAGALANLGNFNQALYFSGGIFEPKAQLILTGNGGGGGVAAPEPGSAVLGIGLLPLVGIAVRRKRPA